jgi:hypothetical protein
MTNLYKRCTTYLLHNWTGVDGEFRVLLRINFKPNAWFRIWQTHSYPHLPLISHDEVTRVELEEWVPYACQKARSH